MTIQTLAVFCMVSVAIGGLAWVFIYPLMSGERQAEQRRASVARIEPVARVSRQQQRSRREQVEETLKELDIRARKSKSLPLQMKIDQAGLSWSKQKFIVVSCGLGLAVLVLAFVFGLGLLPGLAFAFAAGAGAPLWMLTYLRKRREKKFLESFPDAVDVVVRGIKAGLPLIDSLRIIAMESQEPLKGEFRSVIETQAIGMPLGDACIKLYERMPLPEVNFFSIVIAIQQKSGGNLAEALGNLSRVLRDRKKMRAKIQAMSMEAKASATIIGALPVIVAFLVFVTSPKYIELLWTEELGRMMLAGCAVWMSTGVFVMKKMINFDF
ncbi:type II secretion system F family protein [Pseudorhodoplanes sp.]|jgi:tight adherence protein B|uniref:type II secretion system F family protein n=1 Tax=Pseudorhodoplanes sp. TaxID=1934341 RepID=UPI002CE1F0B4|nr:type II secretion system F family protein [Pseudorhodoplanes sp.]HWL31753.1 type II secretion system F family protein [Xanthobacteraceae bacterium]HWV40962.1 type II secretion system F family protein [Pseudorhodoplanes sp.]